MGLLSGWLGDDNSPEEDSDPVSVHNIYFVDIDEFDQPVVDYLLTIGPHKDTGELGLYRVTEPVHIPEGSQIDVIQSGDIIDLGGDPFRAHIAQLVTPEMAEQSDEPVDSLLPLPEYLCGEDYPTHSPWSRERLEELTISLQTQRQR